MLSSSSIDISSTQRKWILKREESSKTNKTSHSQLLKPLTPKLASTNAEWYKSEKKILKNGHFIYWSESHTWTIKIKKKENSTKYTTKTSRKSAKSEPNTYPTKSWTSPIGWSEWLNSSIKIQKKMKTTDFSTSFLPEKKKPVSETPASFFNYAMMELLKTKSTTTGIQFLKTRSSCMPAKY